MLLVNPCRFGGHANLDKQLLHSYHQVYPRLYSYLQVILMDEAETP